MNLVELATELEYVPKDQLAQLSQDPSSRYPQYLVLSEIQRRTANEKAYAAARPQPTTTVAEEVVGEFVQPMSLQAGMPSESAPTDVFSSESMSVPASAPMQQPMMMANGGLTSYAQGGRARASINRSFDTPFLDSIKDRYYDEEGDFNYLTALGDASLLIPIGGAANIAGRVGLAGLRKFAPGVLQKTKGLFTSPNPAISGLRRGQRRVKTDKGFDTIDTATGKKIPAQLFDPVKSVKTLSYPAAATTLISRSIDDEEIKTDNQETETEKQLRLQREAYEKQLAELRNKATAQTEPKKEIDYDLVGLGGLIMGAKNISELGAGLAGLAESKQARKDALLEGEAQQDYYRASAEKVRAEIEGMPLEQKFESLENITETLKLAREGEIELTDQRKLELDQAAKLLTSQILALQGITNNLLTGPDPLEAAKIQ
tara:strand:+ start:99 stop:1391 length:1293 start_codon:yes stop_codon:yes gene_type:complete